MNEAKSSMYEWRQSYRIVLSALLGIGLGASSYPFYTMIVLSEPIKDEFGWSLGDVMGGLMYMSLGVVISSPLIGYLSDMFGARRMILTSCVLFGACFFMFSYMNGSLIVFYGWFLFTVIVGAGTLPITYTRAINNNFDKSRGFALAVALMGTGISGFFIPDLTQGWVDNYGWRNTYRILAMLPLLISLPAALIWFHDPKEKIALKTKRKVDVSVIPGQTFLDALKDWRFYLIGMIFLLIGGAIAGIIPNLKYLLQDQGYTAQMSASKFIGVGLVGLSVILGRTLSGYLIDKFWAPGVACGLLILPTFSCLIFLQDQNPVWLNAIAIFFVGFAAGVEFDVMAFLIGRYFGMKAYGRVYGLVYAMAAIGNGVAPRIYGVMRDITGTYNIALIGSAVMIFISSMLLLTLGKYRNFDSQGKQIPTHT